ncbi:cob(I)alamin adenosyltransferase [Paenibacillus sp. UNCCL117]|uniref:cob(I)yrinic acid a,c-diamide adenosyltransferase n=1 Tax=unclassified Paenibacillus TaxID=185978 RepID=UPI00088DD82F|nr:MULTISPECIES: cob(I)yrinic acid a,c-diamide adenosyltransferase [unclassified Paenibacillus]SDC00888.1 cob(I)alamin adenosyltransferase [Paenibacillus sp. cl123]SFW36463.1 cob(I)alamin adenosyltransferase [Paenibacillus sp. UNCCL117]
MRIYTRTGDAGQTGVIGGRVDKDDDRVEAYGTTDELNCFVGQAMGFLDPVRDADMLDDLLEIQHELFDCGSDLALLKQELRPYKVKAEMVDRLETWIDKYDAETPDIQRFILPGGCLASSALHVCRTVCRRAERRVVTLARTQPINEEVRRYLNRLSDLFFTIARTANFRAGVPDVEYARSAEVFRRKSKS